MFCDQSPFCKNRNRQQFQLMKLVFSTVFTSHFTQEEIIVKSLFFINRLLYYWLLKNLKLTQQKQTCSSKLNTIRQFNMKTKASLGLTNWSQKSLGFTDFMSCVLLLPICLFTGLLDYCFLLIASLSHTVYSSYTHTHNRLMALCPRVHSPTLTHPDHQTFFINFLHLIQSIASVHFKYSKYCTCGICHQRVIVWLCVHSCRNWDVVAHPATAECFSSSAVLHCIAVYARESTISHACS